MKEMDNKVEKSETGLAVFDPTAHFRPEDNLEGTQPRLPKISIVHQGQIFKVGVEENKEPVITGIILDTNRVNAYWDTNFSDSGGGDPPSCSSRDAIKPDDGEDIQSDTCVLCPHNKFGSDGKRGKACKNMRRIHILVEGKFLPLRLTITSSSLRAFDDYMMSLVEKGINYWYVKTEISLVEAQNKDGIAYSQVQFKEVGIVDNQVLANKIDKMRKEMVTQMRGEEFLNEEVEAKDENAENGDGKDPF